MADAAEKLRRDLEAEEALVLAALRGRKAGVQEAREALRQHQTSSLGQVDSVAPKPIMIEPSPHPEQASSKPTQDVLPGLERVRSKKKSGVRLRTEERRLLHQLGCTGVADRRHVMESAGVKKHRLRHLVKQRFLESRYDLIQMPNGTMVYSRYYVLGGKGRAWLRRQGVLLVYRRNPRQFVHDLHLTEAYYHLPAKVRRTWVHESALIARLKNEGRYRRGYSVDAVVTVDGQEHAIEVAIRYKRSDLEKKKAFIEQELGGRGVIITQRGMR